MKRCAREPVTMGMVWREFSRAVQLAVRRRHALASRGNLSLLEWGRRYLPDYFRLPPSKMHRWLEVALADLEANGGKLNVVGPRGSAKSTIGTLAWPLRLAVEGREPYLWIISDTRAQACAHLRNIQAELLDNRRLARDYPDVMGRTRQWRENSIMLRNGVLIEAFGTGQRIRGRRWRARRPTVIIADDLQNDRHIVSAEQRARSRDWFHGMLLKAGTRTTKVVNLATALHRDALAVELLRTPGWNSRRFQAIERWPDQMPMWEQWERLYTDFDDLHRVEHARGFYQANQAEMNRGAELLWPEEEDLHTLMCMRLESGRTAFEREKQGSPIDPEQCEWPEEYFAEPLWFDQWPQHLRVRVLALDPSKGADARHGDYSAYVMLGVDRNGILYVEADLARRPLPQLVADGVAIYRKFKPDALALEGNQFQELLAPLFADEFQRQQVLAPGAWLLNNSVSKSVRIRRLGPYLAMHRLRFRSHSAGTRLLVDQLREFPLAQHDDGPDALEMAVRVAADCLAARPGDGLGNRLTISTP